MIRKRRLPAPLRISLGVIALLFAAAAAVACAGGQDAGPPGTGNSWESTAEDGAAFGAQKGPAGIPAPAATSTASESRSSAALPGRDAGQAGIADGGYGMTEEAYDRLLKAGGDPARAAELAQIEDQFNELADNADAQQVLDYQVAEASQERVIVRSVDMEMEVASVTSSLEEIGNVATGLGGWVVSSNQQQARDGFISVRVPAAQLDSALTQIRDIAEIVKSEVSTSQDFTEEYTDTSARVETLTRNLETLRDLFDQAQSVEDSIAVRSEINKVESDLDALQARLKYLDQSSAYSLLKITLSAKPADVTVKAGDDLVIAESKAHNFQAKFTPPDGIDTYLVTWNFGDGSNERTTDRVAPTTVDGEFITSPVGHIYDSEDSSPFIVTVEIRGTGQGGVIEGKDTLVATVQRIPAIEVFAGDNQVTEEGKDVQFRGSFTRPAGITGLKAEWNFGDGSAPMTVDLDDGTTVAETTHVYQNYRPSAFQVSLKVYGASPAGMAEGTDQLSVQVRQPERLSTSGFDAGGTSRDAAQALANVGTALASFGIWAAILSPIWIIGLVALYLGRRRIVRMRG